MSLPIKKNLSGRRAVVIGSGLAGLSTAVSLAVRGARVVLVEEGPTVAADLQGGDTGGVRFPAWPPFVISPRIFAELFASADLRLTDFLTLERWDPFVRFHLDEGATVQLGAGRDSFLRDIAVVDEQDGARARRFLDRCQRLYEAVEECNAVLAADPSRLPWKRMRSAVAYFDPRSALGVVHATFRNPRIRALFASLHLLADRSMTRHPGVLIHQWSELVDQGGWRIAGGGEALREAMLRLCRELRVRFVRNAALEQIEVSNGRVRRVIGQGMKPMAASLVVCALPRAELIHRLFAKSKLPIDDAIRRLPVPGDPSRFLVRMSIKGPCEVLAPINVLPAADPREEHRFLDRWHLPPADPTLAVTCDTIGQDEDRRTALSVFCRVPPAGGKFKWSDVNTSEYVLAIQQRLEALGMADLRDRIIEESAQGPPPLPDPSKQRRGDGRWGLGYRRLEPRILEVGGFYLAAAGDLDFQGPAAQIYSGMLAGLRASEDAKEG